MRRVYIEVHYRLQCLGYWLRPYDFHLDARCWRWRRPGCFAYFLDSDGTVRRGRWGR